MKIISILSVLVGITGLLLFGVPTGEVWANGTEVLGPPNINIASGSGIVASGTGLKDQPGTINISIPAGATVEQVLLYWSGEFSVSDDDTVVVNGSSVTGTLIGGPTFFFQIYDVTAYRADITGLGLVNPGDNTLIVDGLEYVGETGSPFEIGNHGAGVLVIIDEGGAQSDIDVRDGVDLAFCDFPDPRMATVPQEYSFAPADEPRVADLAMFFGSTLGADAPATRPNQIVIEVFNGTTLVDTKTLVNAFQSNDGLQWDTVVEPVDIPAGADRVVVQPISGPSTPGNLCASFAWIAATLAVPSPPLCSIGDYVWEDADRDGCQGVDERGINGVTVELYEDCTFTNKLADTTTATNADLDGFYQFDNLICGQQYGIRFVNPNDIYAQTEPNSCPDQNNNDVTKDSDCEEDGKVCATAGTDSEPGTINPTIDCGYVCEGEIGDFVWLDTNGSPGCQDPDEPGIDGITVNLYKVEGCPEITENTPIFSMTGTTDGGEYSFTGLCPGDYRVKFVDPEERDNTIVNQNCEAFGLPDSGTKDSDCGGDGECVTLPMDDGNPVDDTIDCGKLPPDCALAVDKKCQVEPPATGPFECDDKVDALKMIWNGPGILQSVEALPGGNDSFPEVEITVENGDQVVTVTDYQPSSNDVIWNWVSNSASDQSKFHLSCSDDEMDGPEDCGKQQGNGKSNEDEFANVWLLDGLATDKGFVFDCTPQPAEPSDNCEFEATPVPGCKTDPEVNDLTSITFRYTGAGCSASDNDQGDKADCVGDPGADPVNITVIENSGKTSSDKASVNVGDTFTLADDFSSESIVDVGEQTLTFHTSCSQPLAVGDVFGSLEVVGINGLSPGAAVTYFYEVTNVGETDAEVTSVFDDQLGELLENSKVLKSGGGSFTLDKTALISETTKNTVTVQGNVAGLTIECSEASDTVTVEVKEPTCDLAIAFDKLEDDKIKWKITNTSSIVATLETFVLYFPDSYGVIEKVKLDGDIYKASESSLVVGPGVPITKDDWTQSDVSKRQLDPGETRDLEVEFTQKGDRSGWIGIDPVGGVNFAEGCEAKFPLVGGCALGNPTELVFEYTGDLCSATTNDQEGKFECEETGTLGDLATVEMTKDANKISVQVSSNEVKISWNDSVGEKFPSEIEYKITGSTGKTQSQTLHTSCSKQLNVGDQFGALILQEFVPED